jgi:hypothetical protein
MMAQEISYGSFDLKGSVAAIASLRSACGPGAEDSASPEAPEGVVYFGRSAPPPGFIVALLAEDRSEFLVFRDGTKDWLEYSDYTYRKCH